MLQKKNRADHGGVVKREAASEIKSVSFRAALPAKHHQRIGRNGRNNRTAAAYAQRSVDSIERCQTFIADGNAAGSVQRCGTHPARRWKNYGGESVTGSSQRRPDSHTGGATERHGSSECTLIALLMKCKTSRREYLELAAFQFFLATDAVFRPRHGVQTLLLNFFLAIRTLAVAAVLYAP